MTGQFPCQWLACSIPSAAFTPSDCLLNILQVILIQEAPAWMKMHTHTYTHPHTHTHTHLALVNAFPSSLPSTPLDTDIPSKKSFIREKSAFSLSLSFSPCLHFSLSLSFCLLLTQSFNTMNEQWVLCTPLNFQIQCVCVCMCVCVCVCVWELRGEIPHTN